MFSLKSFESPIDALVVGAGGGLGEAFVKALLADECVCNVYAWSRRASSEEHAKLTWQTLDIGDETQIGDAAQAINRLTLVIVTTGILHNDEGLRPEKSYKSLNIAHMTESLRINVILPALVAKHTIPKMPRKERVVFGALSARVGSISDNRLGGWYSYRAGKAALNQIIKCLSIEIRRTHTEAVCIGLHPGTVNTGLSQPFQQSMASDHKLFTPEDAADNLLHVINRTVPSQSGLVFAWDGKIIPA